MTHSYIQYATTLHDTVTLTAVNFNLLVVLTVRGV